MSHSFYIYAELPGDVLRIMYRSEGEGGEWTGVLINQGYPGPHGSMYVEMKCVSCARSLTIV